MVKLKELFEISEPISEIPTIQDEKKIIESEILEKYLPEVIEKTKIKVDRKKTKSQLKVNMNRILKKDQELPKQKQKIPMEWYRINELYLRTLEKR